MAYERTDAHEVIRAFAGLQEALLGAWLTTFDVTRQWDSFLDAPWHGTIELLGEAWTFRKHGAGVRFGSSGGTVVEAHDFIFELPRGFDSWRVHLFCESRGIKELKFQGERFDAADDQRVRELLRQMHAAGLLAHAEVDRERYVLVTP